MADDFKNFLATEILSEQRTISYRTASRALKVHVHAAKRMLYEFHDFQNTKKPGSIYATYLLAGTKKKPQTPFGATNSNRKPYNDDDAIPSSPPPFTSSMLEPSQQSSQAEEEEANEVPVKTITLVREDALEEMKEQYETITSIHIYSLSPTRIQDLVTLTDIGRALFTDIFTKEDPLQYNKTYGVIQNPEVRRRKGKRPVIPSGPAPKFQPVKDEPKKPSTTQTKSSTTNIIQSAPKSEESSRPSSRDSTTPKPSKPTLKRDASDLFKAFAKQGQNKKSTPTSTPKPAAEDTPMKDADADDEGESEDEALFLDTNTRKAATSKKRPSDAAKEKAERAAKLRKLVESDDDEEQIPALTNTDNPTNPESETVPVTKTAEAGEEVAWSDSDHDQPKPSTKNSQPAEEDAAAPKRRRAKRQVTKKRTVKDEDGYLVTKEEIAWESFSEEEPPPSKVKSSFGAVKTQTQSQKGGGGGGGKKKGGAGGGGGNIMSFFGKKGS